MQESNIQNLTWDEYEDLAKNLVKMTDKFTEHINISGVRQSKLLQLLKTRRILLNQIINI